MTAAELGTGAPRLRHLSRWLAPMAAAAAVVAIAAVLVVVRGAVHTPGTNGTNGTPASQYVSSGQIPAYYVQITSNGNPNFHPSYAVVRATATGALLGTIQPTVPGGTIRAVTAAADDRTFVLDESKAGNNNLVGTRWFYLLRLGTAGKPASVTKLPMTAGRLVTGVALTADGTRLAISVEPQNAQSGPDETQIRVYALATGAERVWRANGTNGAGEDDAAAISWTADGRYLAFDWTADTPGRQDGVWLLDTTRAGDGLIANSREVVSTKSPALPTSAPSSPAPPLRELTCQGDDIVTPDGSAVICPALATYDDALKHMSLYRNAEVAFLEYATATGKLTSILGHWTIKNAGALTMNVLWTNPSGTVLIGAIPDAGDGTVGIIHGNQFSPLPGAGVQAYDAAW